MLKKLMVSAELALAPPIPGILLNSQGRIRTGRRMRLREGLEQVVEVPLEKLKVLFAKKIAKKTKPVGAARTREEREVRRKRERQEKLEEQAEIYEINTSMGVVELDARDGHGRENKVMVCIYEGSDTVSPVFSEKPISDLAPDEYILCSTEYLDVLVERMEEAWDESEEYHAHLRELFGSVNPQKRSKVISALFYSGIINKVDGLFSNEQELGDLSPLRIPAEHFGKWIGKTEEVVKGASSEQRDGLLRGLWSAGVIYATESIPTVEELCATPSEKIKERTISSWVRNIRDILRNRQPRFRTALLDECVSELHERVEGELASEGEAREKMIGELAQAGFVNGLEEKSLSEGSEETRGRLLARIDECREMEPAAISRNAYELLASPLHSSFQDYWSEQAQMGAVSLEEYMKQNPSKTRTVDTMVKWLQGRVIAPDDYLEEHMRTPLKPFFDPSGFESYPRAFEEHYRRYVSIRQTVPRILAGLPNKIAHARATGKYPKKSEGATVPFAELVISRFAKEIDQMVMGLRVRGVRPLKRRTNREKLMKKEVVVQLPKGSSYPVISYSDVMKDYGILREVACEMLERLDIDLSPPEYVRARRRMLAQASRRRQMGYLNPNPVKTLNYFYDIGAEFGLPLGSDSFRPEFISMVRKVDRIIAAHKAEGREFTSEDKRAINWLFRFLGGVPLDTLSLEDLEELRESDSSMRELIDFSKEHLLFPSNHVPEPFSFMERTMHYIKGDTEYTLISNARVADAIIDGSADGILGIEQGTIRRLYDAASSLYAARPREAREIGILRSEALRLLIAQGRRKTLAGHGCRAVTHYYEMKTAEYIRGLPEGSERDRLKREYDGLIGKLDRFTAEWSPSRTWNEDSMTIVDSYCKSVFTMEGMISKPPIVPTLRKMTSEIDDLEQKIRRIRERERTLIERAREKIGGNGNGGTPVTFIALLREISSRFSQEEQNTHLVLNIAAFVPEHLAFFLPFFERERRAIGTRFVSRGEISDALGLYGLGELDQFVSLQNDVEKIKADFPELYAIGERLCVAIHDPNDAVFNRDARSALEDGRRNGMMMLPLNGGDMAVAQALGLDSVQQIMLDLAKQRKTSLRTNETIFPWVVFGDVDKSSWREQPTNTE